MIKKWRDIGSLYQIYPRSFQDSNGDGVGDLVGIIERLDYLQNLGIEAVWISPFFTSPMTDFGYDVSNYRDVDPIFGNLEDFKRLLHEAHKRHIKILIDLVPCHTSDQHPWFLESASSRDNSKRDYYVWQDPKNGGVPNNWQSLAGGSSWTLDESTGQYYLHSFLNTQPDLNWDNPQVRQEITDVMRWWFDMGVDGMRVDAIWGISKDPNFGDDKINPHFDGESNNYGAFIHNHCKYGPNFEKYLHQLAAVCDEYDDRQLIFEFYPDEQLGNIYDQYQKVMNVHPKASAFFMEYRQMDWHCDNLKYAIDQYLNVATKQAIPFFCLGNHDQPRLASRFSEAKTRALHFLNLSLAGISVVYYGDEIGLKNGDLEPSQLQDLFSPSNTVFDSRDLERTPMQWNNSQFAGFSTAQPWLPIHKNSRVVNVASQENNFFSLLNMHRMLLKLRQAMPLLVRGKTTPIDVYNGYILCLKRQLKNQTVYILINFADASQQVKLPELGRIIASTHPWGDARITDDQIILPPFGGVLVFCS